MTRIIPILFVAALAFGCGKKDDQPAPAPAPTEPAPKPAEPTEVAPEEPAAEVDLPTTTEFEDEANEQITLENLEKELSAIEKEIGQ